MTDRRTDGQTDGIAIAYTRYSYAVARKNEWWDAGVVIWDEVQTCIWPSRCHCHSLSLAPVNPDCFTFLAFTVVVPAHPGSRREIPDEQ